MITRILRCISHLLHHVANFFKTDKRNLLHCVGDERYISYYELSLLAEHDGINLCIIVINDEGDEGVVIEAEKFINDKNKIFNIN